MIRETQGDADGMRRHEAGLHEFRQLAGGGFDASVFGARL